MTVMSFRRIVWCIQLFFVILLLGVYFDWIQHPPEPTSLHALTRQGFTAHRVLPAGFDSVNIPFVAILLSCALKSGVTK